MSRHNVKSCRNHLLVGDGFSLTEISHRRAWIAKFSVLWTALPIRLDALHYCHDSLAWKALFAFFKIATNASTRVRIREHYVTQSECMVWLQTFGIPTNVFPLSVLWNALPIRLDALHFCYDSWVWKAPFAVFKIATNTFTRVRIREHYAIQSECMVWLQTFGIPTHVFPLSDDGTRVIDGYVEKRTRRLALERQRRKALENDEQAGNIFCGLFDEKACRVDVLLGRGRPTYDHPGNIRLRDLIEMRSQEYDVASLAEKQRITGDIAFSINKLRGRFLKDDGCGWVEVDDTLGAWKPLNSLCSPRDDGPMDSRFADERLCKDSFAGCRRFAWMSI